MTNFKMSIMHTWAPAPYNVMTIFALAHRQWATRIKLLNSAKN